ncbi:MAG: hypothetical protein ACYC9P_05020 [Rudaea sp.]
MKADSEKRQQALNVAIAKISNPSFTERAAHTLEVFGKELAALTEAVVENHKAAVVEWRKGVEAENERIARDTNGNYKRLSTFIPVDVYGIHKQGEHRTRWMRRIYDPETRRMSPRKQEIPFNPKTGRQDWRKLGVLARVAPDLDDIFRQTDAVAGHLLLMSRYLKKAREALANIDDHRNLMMGLKARRSKKQKFDEAKTGSSLSKPDAPSQ